MAMHENPASGLLRRDLLYTRWYVWILIASAFDIVMTSMVISLGGIEMNPLADAIISRFGMHGAMAYKFALMIFVILMCEIIGRHNLRLGRWVAQFATLGPAVAAVLGYFLLLRMTSAEYLLD